MPNAKHLQHRNNIVDPTKLTTADITDEKQDLLVHEVKGSKVIAVSHLSDLEGRDGFRPVSSSDSYVPCQNLTNGKGNETVAETKGVLPLETALLKGDLGISMDKNVAEFELPKVVTSCEGASSCHEITDICVDKGVASDEKILSQTSRDSDLEKILLPDKEVSSSLMKGNSEIDSSVSNISEVPKDHCPVDPVENCLPENLVNSTQNSAAEDLRGNSSAAHGNEAKQQSSTVLRDESIAESTAASLNAEETNNCLEETTRDSNTNGVETTLPENCKVKWGSNQKMVTSEANNSQVESGTIAFNSAAFAPTPDYIENNQPLHNQDGSKVSESHTNVGRDQQSHGESSFPVLLGPIACSGSLSVRSDSSVSTSTRSFAFPVLQSEWNSSPVRMAKADRRLCWKHSGWWKGLLCCKF